MEGLSWDKILIPNEILEKTLKAFEGPCPTAFRVDMTGNPGSSWNKVARIIFALDWVQRVDSGLLSVDELPKEANTYKYVHQRFTDFLKNTQKTEKKKVQSGNSNEYVEHQIRSKHRERRRAVWFIFACMPPLFLTDAKSRKQLAVVSLLIQINISNLMFLSIPRSELKEKVMNTPTKKTPWQAVVSFGMWLECPGGALPIPTSFTTRMWWRNSIGTAAFLIPMVGTRDLLLASSAVIMTRFSHDVDLLLD